MSVDVDDLEGRIAVIGMAGRFPGAPDLETFWANVRDGVESIRPLTEAELLAAGASLDDIRDPSYVRAGRAAGGHRPVRRRLLRPEPPRCRRVRSAAPGLPGVRVGGVRAGRLRGRADRGRRRRVRVVRAQRVHVQERAAQRAPRHVRRRVVDPAHRQRHQLPGHPGVLRARPARPEPERADGVQLDARRGAPGLPEPAQRGVRRRPRRRLGHRARAGARLLLQGGRDPLARRPLPGVRRQGCRHGHLQRRRLRAAQAVGERAGGRRHRAGGHPRIGDQQRRSGQGRLPRAERPRTGPGRHGGVGRRRRRGP